MKKILIALLSLLICVLTIGVASARTTTNSELTSAIKLYKAQNYAQCYLNLSNIVQKDPSNAVAYYYLAMSAAQIGKKEEAISNYSKVLSLTPGGKLGFYANKGKTCLETPEKCSATEDGENDNFIRGAFGSGFSTKVRSDYEKQKIDNIMREMNRNDEISPQTFKDYKDFSSSVPTNDEIVSALRVLQNAGLGGIIGNSGAYSDLSLINNGNYNNDLWRIFGGNSSNEINPRVIQALLTSQMSANF